MKTKKLNEELFKLTTCKACRGKGGRYIAAKSKKKKQKTEVIFEECSVCEGKGKVEDKRTREEKLDEWQNETNLWIDCKDCDADGYVVDEISVMAGTTAVAVKNSKFTMPAANVTVTVTFKAEG